MTESEQRHLQANVEVEYEKVPPPTFAQRLKMGALQMARDFRGTSLRLSTSILISSVEYATLIQVGVSGNDAAFASLATVAATIAAGEIFFWRKISKRLPWFGISFMDLPLKKN